MNVRLLQPHVHLVRAHEQLEARVPRTSARQRGYALEGYLISRWSVSSSVKLAVTEACVLLLQATSTCSVTSWWRSGLRRTTATAAGTSRRCCAAGRRTTARRRSSARCPSRSATCLRATSRRTSCERLLHWTSSANCFELKWHHRRVISIGQRAYSTYFALHRQYSTGQHPYSCDILLHILSPGCLLPFLAWHHHGFNLLFDLFFLL